MTIKSPLVASGTATRTILQIRPGALQTLKPVELYIGCKGADAAATPIEFELVEQSTSGTSTDATALIEHASGLVTAAIVSTAIHTATGEPTTGNILKGWILHPNGGSLVYTFPEPDLWETAIDVRLGIRCITPAATVNVVCGFEYDAN